VVLAGGGTSQITPIATSVLITQQPSGASLTATVLLPPGATQNRAQSTSSAPTSISSSNPTNAPFVASNSRTSKPIGAIMGGAVGGIVLVAFICFLSWYCLRKRGQEKAFALAAAQNQQQQADAATAMAFHNFNQISEIGGTPKPAAAFIQPPSPRTGVHPDKPTDGNQSAHIETTTPGSPGTPPSASQPSQWSPSILSPMSNYSVEEQRRFRGMSPISPLSGQARQMGGEVNGVGGPNWGSLNFPPGLQEINGSNGGVNRRPVGGHNVGVGQYVDMSGAPLNDGIQFHELE
jgi:hypothetical protein